LEYCGETYDNEISWLFDESRSQLEKIENNSRHQKKQVIKDLAKSLEGKIPIDSICIEITNQLKGKVSESFVRQCLDDKYKQSYRARNGKKQNNKQTSDKRTENVEKLASVTTLNEEDHNDKIIMVEANGQALVQRKGNDNPHDESFLNLKDPSPTDENKIQLSSKMSCHDEPKQQLKLKPFDSDLKECSGCQELYAKVIELSDALKKATQFVIAGQTVYPDQTHETSDIVQFEYSMVFDKMQKYLAPLYPKIGPHGDVWLKGQIDKKTGKVISLDFGRINQQF
jgi:hypothetical protein